MTTTDPYESYLRRAEDLFTTGNVVQSGQIWQAILKRDPNHIAARDGLLKVKERLESLVALPAAPAPPTSVAPINTGQEDPEIVRLLEQGCTLYDSGHLEDAIKKWEKILIKNPDHAMARGYISGARKRLGQTPPPPSPAPAPDPRASDGVRATIAHGFPLPIPMAAPSIPSHLATAGPRDTTEGMLPPDLLPEPPARTDLLEAERPSPPVLPHPVLPHAPEPQAEVAPPAEPESDKWLREGCTLYDMGQTEEALKIWERILTVDPHHTLALEYSKGARRDLGLPPLSSSPSPQAPPAPAPLQSVPDSSDIEQLLREAAQLYDMGMTTEAVERWKRVTEAAPGHPEAQTYLAMANKSLLAEAERKEVPAVLPHAPKPQAEVAPPAEPESDKWLREGCTLYDMGQAEEALKIWERVLTVDPHHTLALEYSKGARRDLGLPPLSSSPSPQAPPAPVPVQSVPDSSDIEQLLREAAQLYDMGMTTEAVERWKRVTEAAPGHPEAEAYLAMANKSLLSEAENKPVPAPELTPLAMVIDLAEDTSRNKDHTQNKERVQNKDHAQNTEHDPSKDHAHNEDHTQPGNQVREEAPQPAPPQPPAHPVSPEVLDLKLHQAERLLQLLHVEEAIFAFQRVLQMDPGNTRALEGFQKAKALRSTNDQAASELGSAPTDSKEEAQVHPPASVTAQAPARQGLPVSGALAELLSHPLLRNPAVLIGVPAGIVIAVVGFLYFQTVRRDDALKAAVLQERNAAMSTQEAVTPDLTETIDAIKQEASSALSDDPLRAYYRAQEAHRLNSTDPGAASLMDRAKAALASQTPNPGLLKDYQRFLQTGDLDSAEKALLSLQRTSPEDFDLKNRQSRLCLAMAQILASRERWEEAKQRLKLGRAMFPQEKAWQARLVLLERLPAIPKGDRVRWIPLLG